MNNLSTKIFDVSEDIRYVAIYKDGKLVINQREDLVNVTDLESDHYEELLVNPTIITLLTQRGNIDCGGFEYTLISYGNFYQFVAPLPNGHISIAIERDSNPMDYIKQLNDLINAI